MATRLNSDMRGDIVHAVLEHRFAEAIEARRIERAALADRIYRDVYAAELKRMDALPDGWLPTSNYIKVEAHETVAYMFNGVVYRKRGMDDLMYANAEDVLRRVFSCNNRCSPVKQYDAGSEITNAVIDDERADAALSEQITTARKQTAGHNRHVSTQSKVGGSVARNLAVHSREAASGIIASSADATVERDAWLACRRRSMTDWGATIQTTNGERPTWLCDGEEIYSPWSTGTGVPERIQWDALHRAGRGFKLPVNHPYYTATEADFEYWPGGDTAPDDWDGGEVMSRGGEIAKFVEWRHPWNGSGPITPHDIIGYRKRTVKLTGFASAITIDSKFEPWSGGDNAPADWDQGPVLLRDGRMLGVPGRWDHMVNTRHTKGDVVGYRKRTDDMIRVKRMTRDEWIKLTSRTDSVTVLRRLGIIHMPTEAERIAATTGLTVAQVQSVIDAQA